MKFQTYLGYTLFMSMWVFAVPCHCMNYGSCSDHTGMWSTYGWISFRNPHSAITPAGAIDFAGGCTVHLLGINSFSAANKQRRDFSFRGGSCCWPARKSIYQPMGRCMGERQNQCRTINVDSVGHFSFVVWLVRLQYWINPESEWWAYA